MTAPSLPLDSTFSPLVCDSHRRLTGVSLVPEEVARADISRWLYEEAPFALLVQDTADDPMFVYANLLAQAWFGYSWDEFCGLPSRLSAPPGHQAGRATAMARVRDTGYTRGYRGLRRHSNGRHFRIEDVTIWNLVDAEGALRGQAAAIHSRSPE
ncbi:MEKHLA domain-containing protein [Streptomyces nigra]|uniref:MEKHLA domain-containing protein n=1 Tax=Streptomyces nigra TaxID=1827580 RepID=UPI0036A90EC5